MSHTTESPVPNSPIEAARVAIWRLFEEGYVDEDMATASLLAVDVGARRGPHDGRARLAHSILIAPHQTKSRRQRAST